MATKAGGRVCVELSTANHYAADGALERLVGFAEDITRRKQGEMAMLATQEELRRARDELEVRVQERTAQPLAANRALQEENEQNRRAVAALREGEHFV